MDDQDEYDVVDIGEISKEEDRNDSTLDNEEGNLSDDDKGNDNADDDVVDTSNLNDSQIISLSDSANVNNDEPDESQWEMTQEDIDLFLSIPDYVSGNAFGPSPNQVAKKTQRRSPNPANNVKRRFQNRKMPDFKVIPGTKFVVDGFKFRSQDYQHYFLSHFHSDHYGGLVKSFKEGQIYCSTITAKLVIQQLRVDPKYIIPLEMNQTYTIDDVEVTLLDANHCPGASLILFKVKGLYYLHTGDFRYHPSMKMYPVLQDIKFEAVFLDNTFCDPKYVFPPQSAAISNIVDIVRKEIRKSTLFLCGTYTIGKEKVFTTIAKTFNVKVFVSPDKHRILSCLDMDCGDIFTTNASESCVHVVPMGAINFKKMYELKALYRKYDKIIGFQPTGWAFGKSIQDVTKRTSGAFTIYGVPYSEHSNYNELREFIAWAKPNKIIPTVDCSTPEKVRAILSHFTNLNEDKTKTTLFPYLKSGVDKIKNNIISMFQNVKNNNNSNNNNNSYSNNNNSNSCKSSKEEEEEETDILIDLTHKVVNIDEVSSQDLPPLEDCTDDNSPSFQTLLMSQVVIKQEKNNDTITEATTITSTSSTTSNSITPVKREVEVFTENEESQIDTPGGSVDDSICLVDNESIDLENVDFRTLNQQNWILRQIFEEKARKENEDAPFSQSPQSSSTPKPKPKKTVTKRGGKRNSSKSEPSSAKKLKGSSTQTSASSAPSTPTYSQVSPSQPITPPANLKQPSLFVFMSPYKPTNKK